MKKIVIILALIFVPVTSNFTQWSAQDEAVIVSPETGINYDRLAKLLTKQEWREANDETFNLLLKASGRASQGWMNTESFYKLPCADLKIIDQLWTEHSQGRFGFSVQLPIFIQTGNKPGKLVDEEAYDRFGDQVGWRKDNDWIAFIENLTYSLDAPEGHLPNPRYEYEVTGSRLEYTTFAQRVVECKLVENLPEPEPPAPLNTNEPNLQI